MSKLSSSYDTLSVVDQVFDILPSGIILVEQPDMVVLINNRARLLLDLPEGAVFNEVSDFPEHLHILGDLLTKTSLDVHRAELNVAIPNREEESTILGYSLRRIDVADKSTITVFTFTDITQIIKDRQSMEKIRDELGQSKKLASIGTMIAGVAHELNNPLTGISMSTDLSRMSLERLKAKLENASEEVTSEQTVDTINKLLLEVNKINTACKKAGALVGDLLAYSKPTKLEMVDTQLNALVDEVLHAAKSQTQFSQFKMTIDPPEKNFWVMADVIKVEQVFYNLFKNACEATGGNGDLKVWYTEEESNEGFPCVIVHVRDNGPGIDKTILARIFDPFFSTKGNKGVGLGLSISYRTIEQHGGLLSVDSQQGEWTEFRVALPYIRTEVISS